MATGGSICSTTRLAVAERRGMQLPPSRIPAPARGPAPPSTTTPGTPTATSTSTPPEITSGPPRRRLEIIHEDKQYRKRKKEARRAEIVSAVTRRLYSTKKEKPSNPSCETGGSGDGQTDQVVAAPTDEPDELKLCSNARARLQEIGRKVMRRMRRQGVDVETQTDFGPVVQRVREVAVQTTNQRASSATQTGYLGWNYSCHAVNSHADIPKSPTILGCVTRSMQTQASEKCTKEVASETEMPFRQSFYLNYQRRCKSRGAPPSYSIVFRKRINRVENEYYSDDSLDEETATKETPSTSKAPPGKSLGAAEACALIRELRALFIDWQKHAERNRPIKQVESRPVQTDPEFRIRERQNHNNVRVCFSENKKSDDNDEDGLREGVAAPLPVAPPAATTPAAAAAAATSPSSMFIPWNILNMYIMKSLMNMPHFPKPPEETKTKPEQSTSKDFDPEPTLQKRAPCRPPPEKQQDHQKEMQDIILGRNQQTYPYNIEIEEETERKVKKSTKKKSVSWTDLSGSGSLHTEIGVRERRSSLDIGQPCRPPGSFSLTPPPVTAVQMTAFIKEAGHLVKSLTKIQKNQVRHRDKIPPPPPPPPPKTSQEKAVQTERGKRPHVYFQEDDNDPDLDPLPQIQTFDEEPVFEPKTYQVKPPRESISPRAEWGELVSPRVYRERLLRVRRNIVAEERVSY